MDGGDVIEFLLFSRILNDFSLKENLFLLCKDSYKDNYKTFRKNFMEVSKKNLDELYNEANKDSELSSLMKSFNITLNSIKKLENQKINSFKFKRNGDILCQSKCGDFRF